MKFSIVLSWSKIMALVFQTMAFWLDIKYGTKGTIFMFCLPFAVLLITGKQIVDMKKETLTKDS